MTLAELNLALKEKIDEDKISESTIDPRVVKILKKGELVETSIKELDEFWKSI